MSDKSFEYQNQLMYKQVKKKQVKKSVDFFLENRFTSAQNWYTPHRRLTCLRTDQPAEKEGAIIDGHEHSSSAREEEGLMFH